MGESCERNFLKSASAAARALCLSVVDGHTPSCPGTRIRVRYTCGQRAVSEEVSSV